MKPLKHKWLLLPLIILGIVLCMTIDYVSTKTLAVVILWLVSALGGMAMVTFLWWEWVHKPNRDRSRRQAPSSS